MILSDEELNAIIKDLRAQLHQIAKEAAQEIMDEHLDDYEHKEKKAQVELYP